MDELKNIIGKTVSEVIGVWDKANEGDQVTIKFTDNTSIDVYIMRQYGGGDCGIGMVFTPSPSQEG